jgi:tetratricopeptide (TPR) repeat protein
MANNKKYKKPAPKKSGGAQPAAQLAEQQVPMPINVVLPVVIAIVTFICYSYTLHNQFLDWDDWIYVQKDPYITSFSAHNLKMMLFHNITKNYFHPITMLSLAMNYHFSKLAPEGYYFTNVLIHSLNTVLIFILVRTLLEEMAARRGYGKIQNIPWVAGMCALMHGIHPMHVESVAWMCERKDILYSFFYFMGLIAYIRFAREQTLKAMGIVVVLYCASLMSKPMAVSFPFSLFAFDVILKRDRESSEVLPIFKPFADIAKAIIGMFSGFIKPLRDDKRLTAVAKVFGEKAPFFIISLAGGILVYFTAKESGSIAFLNGFTLLHKLTVPFYSFMMYAVKAIVPFNLCSYYPYPPVTTTGWIPAIFYIGPVIVAAMVGIPMYLSYKSSENNFRVVFFGIGFYFANVLFILQFLSAGVAIMCERYSYIAYGGIFFMIAYFLNDIVRRKPEYKVPIVAAVLIFAGSLAYICRERTKTWHNSETFWKDVIVKYPRQWLVPYMNLAQYYVDSNKMDSAFTYYKILVELHSTGPEIYRNLANIYGMHQQYDKALPLYEQALKYDSSGGGDIYLDRAVTYSIMGKLDLAIPDYNKAYAKDTNSEKILSNRGYAYMQLGQFDLSMADYNHLIRINPNEPSYYLRRGQDEIDKGDISTAIKDLTKCLASQPNNGECLYDMALAYSDLKDYPTAQSYVAKAKQAGFQVPQTFLDNLQKNAGSR